VPELRTKAAAAPEPFSPLRLRTATAALVLLASALRLGFWAQTGLTLEDALITARYAENIAAGRGFVYNEGEKVLGTTTPLWTLLLAAADATGVADPVTAAKALGVILDALTLLLVVSALRRDNPAAALLFAAAFAASPDVIPVAVSGMETPMLLFAMALAIVGLSRGTSLFAVGLALTVLTRIDGALFAAILGGWAVIRTPRWGARQLLLAAAICLPWFLFAAFYFGSPLPQSLLAKRAAYRFDAVHSAAPFLNMFTPLDDPRSWTSIPKTLLALVCAAGIAATARTERRHLPLSLFFVSYCTLFALSGTVIFSWYLVPPRVVFWILVSIGAAALLRRVADPGARTKLHALSVLLAALLLGAGTLAMLPARMQKFARLQEFEDRLRKPLGLWLKENAPAGSTVLLEPIGYIGYFAGPSTVIRDEVGLVSPGIPPYRMRGAGWYGDAVEDLRPDFVVHYTHSLRLNRTEATGVPLFRDPGQRARFDAAYTLVHAAQDTASAPWMAEQERSYVILRRLSRR